MSAASRDTPGGGHPPRRPLTPPSQRRARRWQRLAWRHRHLLALAAVALAASVVVNELRPPPPPSEPVVVLARDVAAGAVLTAADITVEQVPAQLAPRAVVRDPADVVGRRLAVGLPADFPLTSHLLAGPGLAAGVPRGNVVVPVRLADGAVAALLRPGDTVDLLTTAADAAGTAGAARVVVAGAVVVSLEDGASGGLLATDQSAPLLLVSLPRQVAADVVGAAAWAPLRLVIPPPDP